MSPNAPSQLFLIVWNPHFRFKAGMDVNKETKNLHKQITTNPLWFSSSVLGEKRNADVSKVHFLSLQNTESEIGNETWFNKCSFICGEDIWQEKHKWQHNLFETDDLCLPCKISCFLLFISYLLMWFMYFIDKKKKYKIWTIIWFRPNMALMDDVTKLKRTELSVVGCNVVLTRVNA